MLPGLAKDEVNLIKYSNWGERLKENDDLLPQAFKPVYYKVQQKCIFFWKLAHSIIGYSPKDDACIINLNSWIFAQKHESTINEIKALDWISWHLDYIRFVFKVAYRISS